MDQKHGLIRSGRRSARLFWETLGGLVKETDFFHGLYVLLRRSRPLDEQAARRAASEMSSDLGRAGFPIRHAGSFGFDFAAAERFHDIMTGDFCVRIAVPDIPTEVWDEQTRAIARWWKDHDSR